jgi:hypothetical protein
LILNPYWKPIFPCNVFKVFEFSWMCQWCYVGVKNSKVVHLWHCLGICRWIGLCKVVPRLWGTQFWAKPKEKNEIFYASSTCFADNKTMAFEVTIIKQVAKACPSVRGS